MLFASGQRTQLFEDGHCLRRKMDKMRPPALRARGWNAPQSSFEIEFNPHGVSDFTLTLSGQDQDAEIEPVPTDAEGRRNEPEIDRLSNILKTFNEQFGTLFTDADRVVNTDLAERLKFLADESFDEASRIDALLADPKVARDLSQGEPDDA